MKTTKTIWTMLVAGSLFASCQSNNKPVAYQDTTANATIYDKDGVAAVPASPDALNATSNATGATAAATTDTTTMVCKPKYPQRVSRVSHPVYPYYASHKRRTKTVTKTEVEETNVAVVEPTPVENVAPVAQITQPAVTPAPLPPVVTYEKKAEFTGNVPAEPANRSKVHLAPEAGVNLNNLYNLGEGNFTTSNELKVGFNGGVMLNMELGRRLSLEPGVRYIMKGALLTSTSTSPNGLVTTETKDKLTYHYVEVPVNFVYNFGDWGTNRFMIGAGPYISYLANAQDKTKDKIQTTDGTTTQQGQHSLSIGDPDHNGNLRNFDAGAGAFIGYQMRSGVYLKGGAEVGLLDMQKNATTGDFNSRNYNFLFSIGYLCGYNK